MISPTDLQLRVTTFDEQPERLEHEYTGPCYHTIVYGPLGSGKSLFGLRAFIAWAMLEHSGKKFVIAAKTQQILDTEIRETVEEFLEELGVLQFAKLRTKNWIMPSMVGRRPNVFLTMVFGEGERPARRIQGTNLQGAIVDEGNNMQPSLRKELCRRLRLPGARALWTLNPVEDEFKTEFVDLVENGSVVGEIISLPAHKHPGIDDNYYEQQLALCSSDWEIEVYLKGNWAAPGHLIYVGVTANYPTGNRRNMPDDAVVRRYLVGMDWGGKTVSHALLIADTDQGFFIIDEWRWSVDKQGAIDDVEMARRVVEAFAYVGDIAIWTIDKHSGGLIYQLQELGQNAVASDPQMDIKKEGIEKVGVLFYNKRMFLTDAVPELTKELRQYRRKELPSGDRNASGTIQVIKRNDHGCDGLRYGVEHLPVRTITQSKREPSRIYRAVA